MAPTWLAISRSRRAWKASPSGNAGAWSPNQLASTMRASKAAQASARRSPASLADACTTSSCSIGARSGNAKSQPNRRASPSRVRSISTTVTRVPGIRASSDAQSRPTTPAPTTSMRSPASGAASQSDIERRLHIRSEHGTRRRHRVGHRNAHRLRREKDVLVRMQCEDPPAIGGRSRRRCSRISPETGAARPSAAHASSDAGSPGTRPANTSDSVPRETPLASVRTRRCLRRRRGQRLGADLALAGRDGPERARVGHSRAPGRMRASGMSSSRSAPRRCTDHSKRSPSVRVRPPPAG